MFTPNPLVPNFTPSDWLNADTPSSFNFSFDYFNQLNDMQIPGQAGLDTAAVQAQAQQQQQQQVRANSGGMFNPNLWLFQEPDALAGSLNAGASGSGSASGVTIESTNERTSSSSSVSTSNHTPDIMGAPLGTVISGTSSSSAGPSRYDSSPQMAFDRPNAIPTSLLTSATNSQESIDSKPNIDSPDSFDDLTFSLSRVQSQASAGPSSSHRRSHSLNHGTLPHTHGPHPHSHLNPQYGYHPYADKRRASSFDSMDSSHEPDLVDLADVDDHEHGLEHELGHEHDGVYEIHEGIERDGMIWGMKVEEYRALSARERKRVRNRISARTFRAKRKGEWCADSLPRHHARINA